MNKKYKYDDFLDEIDEIDELNKRKNKNSVFKKKYIVEIVKNPDFDIDKVEFSNPIYKTIIIKRYIENKKIIDISKEIYFCERWTQYYLKWAEDEIMKYYLY